MTLNPAMFRIILLGDNIINFLPQSVYSMLNRVIIQIRQERHTPQTRSRRTPDPQRFIRTLAKHVFSAVLDERMDGKGREAHGGNGLEERALYA